MKVKIKKVNLPLAGIGLICVLLIILFVVSRLSALTVNSSYKVDSASGAAEYLARFGWEVSNEPSSVREVEIPSVFTPSYESYNTLQKSQGFDLSHFRGKTATMYTFRIRNHPTGKDVFGNVLAHNGEVIAGDVVSYAIDGFLTGLDGRR